MRPSDHSHRVKVWDLPTRLFHWLLVALIVALGVSGELGKLDLHMIIGPAVLVLILFRLVWGLIGSETARFSHFVRGPKAIRAYLSAARTGAVRSVGHNPLGAFSVLALLSLVLVQSLTGLFTSDDILSEGPLAHLLSAKSVALISTVHRICFKLLLAFIVLHLAAVAFYRFVKKDDMVEAMITGTKKVPTTVAGIRFRNPLLALAALAVCAALVWGTLAALPAPAF
ncbi:cytochrome b/b6 domain-containing protein [Magnetospirillum sulfuroxidans]|uniref:Cytochrome b/b6 domain-containing protein n=1 Tax=Magnetospirillum sulfuroxidans TaxID=611300 RepID=A0ABS5IA20_9PROT|nr:cytochrome b/b6 domain-containing protein [Magnetospirillum sulfuroxidans]MBR9971255.1 cytochrome b/b6 domain-containing protein [Magnetospirillum sulfuroxidans]